MEIYWAGLSKLPLLPFFIIPAVLLIYRALLQKRALTSLASTHRKALFSHIAGWRSLTKAVAWSLGLACIFVAILQPQWGKVEQNIIQTGRDLLVILDVSGSMRAKDFKPSRLEFAKLKIRRLLEKLTCERVGLMLFSGSAFLQCPMTADHAAFLMFLDNVDTESISSGTTALDQALGKAVETFSNAGPRKNKLVLLLTDGEDFSTHLAGAGQQAKKAGITLLTLGIGSAEGAPIPKLDMHGKQIGHETNQDGTIALSKLNEETLQKISGDLNGLYVKADYPDSDIAKLTSHVQSFEKERYEDKTLSFYHDQYPWFLGAAWIFLALEWLL